MDAEIALAVLAPVTLVRPPDADVRRLGPRLPVAVADGPARNGVGLAPPLGAPPTTPPDTEVVPVTVVAPGGQGATLGRPFDATVFPEGRPAVRTVAVRTGDTHEFLASPDVVGDGDDAVGAVGAGRRVGARPADAPAPGDRPATPALPRLAPPGPGVADTAPDPVRAVVDTRRPVRLVPRPGTHLGVVHADGPRVVATEITAVLRLALPPRNGTGRVGRDVAMVGVFVLGGEVGTPRRPPVAVRRGPLGAVVGRVVGLASEGAALAPRQAPGHVEAVPPV